MLSQTTNIDREESGIRHSDTSTERPTNMITHKDFQNFVRDNLVKVENGSVQLRWLYVRFIESIPLRADRALWRRWRFLGELQEMGITVAKRSKIDELVGWSLRSGERQVTLAPAQGPTPPAETQRPDTTPCG